MILNRQTGVRVSLPSLTKFLHNLKRTLRLGRKEISVCLVSDREMAKLNARFRGKQETTDVLSFPVASPGKPTVKRITSRRRLVPSLSPNGKAPLSRLRETAFYLGDIAISPETARRNAMRFGRTLPAELRVLILHGLLHLMGYDHEADSGQMDRIESRLRKRLRLQ